MRIAIVGGGSIGSRHARNAKALGHDVRVFDSDFSRGEPISDVWLFRPQAAIICTPASVHHLSAMHLQGNGFAGPLFVEKPIATGRAEIFNRWPHPVTMVGYNLRFHPAVEHMRRCRPTSGDLTLECDSRTWPGAAYGDLLLECSHEIDLALALGAEPDIAGTTYLREHSADFRLGPRWGVHLNDRADRYLRRWDVSGKTSGCSFVFRDPVELTEQTYVDELRHFLLCVETGRPTAITFSDGLRVVEICERVKELAS